MKNNFDNLIEIYKYLEQNNSDIAQEIYYGFELFTNSLENAIKAFQKEIASNSTSGDYSKLHKIVDFASTAQNLKAEMDKCLTEMSTKDANKINYVYTPIINNDNKKVIQQQITTNEEYAVDKQSPHPITEDFTYKKVCGFKIYENRYNVDTWQDVLIVLCNLLIKKDLTVFSSFVDNPTFKGGKIQYFSSENNNNKYYRLLNNANIYVWTNFSANSIRDIIIKMLKEYNIPQKNFTIFLKKDYTPKHKIKIGKYVKETMRNLSDNGYVFSNEMMYKLLSAEETKKIFGIGFPFFKEIRNQEITENSIEFNRYWKETFKFNGKDYLIINQWKEDQRKKFDKWKSKL